MEIYTVNEEGRLIFDNEYYYIAIFLFRHESVREYFLLYILLITD